MIRYLEHHQIDKAQWDHCVSLSPNGLIYCYSWYLDIVSPGWHALVMDDYQAVMPLTFRRKYSMNYLFQPYFTQQLGVFSKENDADRLAVEFLKSIPAKFKFIEINLNQSHLDLDENFHKILFPDYLLTMNREYETIYREYNENLKRNIKKATSKNLSISLNADSGEIIEMFRKNRGRDVSNLKDSDYLNFKKLVDEVRGRNMGEIRLVSDENGVPCAGAVFFESHGRGIFIFSATNPKGKDLSAMHLLIDSYIRDNCMKLKVLDFEGSKDPDLARFYRSFGSQETVYLHIKKNQLPAPWKWFKQ